MAAIKGCAINSALFNWHWW